jgi:hypothetical protein
MKLKSEAKEFKQEVMFIFNEAGFGNHSSSRIKTKP